MHARDGCLPLYFIEGGLIRSAIPAFLGFEHCSCNAKGFSGCEIRTTLDGVWCASVAINMCQQHYQQRKANNTSTTPKKELQWVRFKATTLCSLGTSALPNELTGQGQ